MSDELSNPEVAVQHRNYGSPWSIALYALAAEKMSVSAVFIPWHGANGMSLLTKDALEQANIPQFKVSVVQVFLARENDLTDPQGAVQKGRY